MNVPEVRDMIFIHISNVHERSLFPSRNGQWQTLSHFFMPCLQVVTNLTLTAAQKQETVAALSKLVAQATGKPESYVQVVLRDGAAVLFGGAPGNSVFLDLQSIGSISRAQNKKTSASLTKYFEQFGVSGDRIYISFQNAAGENWGFSGGTFG
jgi:phenylpyruvate tautomerase